MPREISMHRCLVILLISIAASLPANRAVGEDDKKVLLKPEKCRAMVQSQTEKLPIAWKKYNGFIKACSIFKSGAQEINLISIWIQDYFDFKYPKDITPVMEDFPRPILVDQKFNVLGSLPEYYPDDPPRELEIYYYSKKNTPPDLFVRVHNPGAGGDYSYPPMMWNVKNKSYGN